MLDGLMFRVRALLRRETVEGEMEGELRAHIQERAEDLMRSGVGRAEAERRARIEFGGYQKFKEEIREVWGTHMLETILQDVRYGFRTLRKAPGFTTVAVLTLALGIGANTAIFSVVSAVILRPLPFRDPGRMMIVWHTPPQKSFPGMKTFVVSIANFIDWRAQNHVFERISAIGFEAANFTGQGQPEVLSGVSVTSDFFPMLGVGPSVGRDFLPEEDQAGHGHVVIVGDSFAQNHFGGARNALSKTIVLDQESFSIIGVMPPGFDFPFHQEFWRPTGWTDKQRAVRGNHYILVMARLKAGVKMAQAQAEMDAISARLAEQYPADDAGWGAVVLPLQDDLLGPTKPALLVLLGAVAFVVLIACVNVANLTLAKAIGRRKETAIRAALGASRRRVIQQMLAETLLLSAFGGVMAVVLAHYVAQAIAAYLAPQLAQSVSMGIDGWVLTFTLAIVVATGILAGIGPSWHLMKTDPNESLKAGLGKTSGDSGSGRLRGAFVVAEVALSLVLLAGAGLMIRTLANLRSVNAGFDPHNVLTVPVGISKSRYPADPQQINFYNSVAERVRALPGVQSAAWIDSLPLQGGSSQPVQVEGQPVVAMADQPEVATRLISPGYLATMRISLRQGRDFTDADRAESQPVVLVSESFARRFWPNENALGKHVTMTFTPLKGGSREVVGVVGDAKLDALGSTQPGEAIYEVMAQNPETTQMTLVLRTSGAPTSLTSAVTDAVHRVDGDEPVTGALTMDAVVDQSLSQKQLSVTLLATFAALALLLATVGIYGVQAYSARQQSREIGIRMALGAQRSDVFTLMVGQGLKLAVVGIGIGLGGALLLTRLIAAQLYGLKATDPLTLGGVSVLLVAVVMAACYFPARRATRVDPVVVLRDE